MFVLRIRRRKVEDPKLAGLLAIIRRGFTQVQHYLQREYGLDKCLMCGRKFEK